MKIGIIGGGISGLSIAQLLKDDFEIEILEKESAIGGIAKVKKVNGIAYHLVGGHCFNSKDQRVLDFVFNKILPKGRWHIVERNAKIYFKGHYISYPIEYSIREIFSFDEDLAFCMLVDFFCTKFDKPSNLAEWFIQKFGKTLAEKYFIPYSRKIWKMDPYNMDYQWVFEKLPIPNKKAVFISLFKKQSDDMPHKVFYYPNTNTQETFIKSLSKDLKILLNYEVVSIEKINNKFVVNGEKKYDILINTSPLNKFPLLVKGVPPAIINIARTLKYNIVTNMLWETEEVEHTWTYFPEETTFFHRHIHIGNFFRPKANYTITEVIGFKSYEDMVREGKKFDYLKNPLSYNVSDHAYVVFDQHTKKNVSLIKAYLSEVGIFTLGRFGEWDYYNMDVCISKAIDLSHVIKNKYLNKNKNRT